MTVDKDWTEHITLLSLINLHTTTSAQLIIRRTSRKVQYHIRDGKNKQRCSQVAGPSLLPVLQCGNHYRDTYTILSTPSPPLGARRFFAIVFLPQYQCTQSIRKFLATVCHINRRYLLNGSPSLSGQLDFM